MTRRRRHGSAGRHRGDRLLSMAEVGRLLSERLSVPEDPKLRSQWLVRTFRRLEETDGERYLHRFGEAANSKLFVSVEALERALPYDPGTQQALARKVRDIEEEIRDLRRRHNGLAATLRKMAAD
jgi:hypothetical protein